MAQYFFLTYFRTQDSSLFFTLPILIMEQELDAAVKRAHELTALISSQYDLVLSPSAPVRYQSTRHALFFNEQVLKNPVPFSVATPLGSVLSQPNQTGLVVSVAVLSKGINVAPFYLVP